MLLPEKCEFCTSKNVKVSQAYPSDYYCKDCTKGGPLKAVKENENTYYSPDPFTIICRDKYGNIIDIVSWDI